MKIQKNGWESAKKIHPSRKRTTPSARSIAKYYRSMMFLLIWARNYFKGFSKKFRKMVGKFEKHKKK